MPMQPSPSAETVRPWCERRLCSIASSLQRHRCLPRGGARKRMSAMRIERSRRNVFTVTATGQELSALVAGARMALEAMRSAPEPPPPAAIEILERVLSEFDSARERLTSEPPGGG